MAGRRAPSPLSIRRHAAALRFLAAAVASASYVIPERWRRRAAAITAFQYQAGIESSRRMASAVPRLTPMSRPNCAIDGHRRMIDSWVTTECLTFLSTDSKMVIENIDHRMR